MSQFATYSIRCPKCSQEQSVELCDSVNVVTDPGLKDKLMHNELNSVACPGCGYRFRVDKPLLYNDPARHFMIHLLAAAPADYDRKQEEFSSWVSDLSSTLPSGVQQPDVHLVFNRVELVERIFLLEAGLNERIIEYVKHLIYSRNPEKLDPVRKVLLFNAQDSTAENLCFVVQDASSMKLEGLIEFPRDAYKGLCEMFDQDEQTPSLMELFPGPYVSARQLLIRDSQAARNQNRR